MMHLGRCEVWTEDISATAHVDGASCNRCIRVSKSMTADGFGIEWEPVNGGVNQACRSSQQAEASDVDFGLMSSTSLHRCQEQCIMSPTCTGVEYSSKTGRCEVWTKQITESSKVSDYVCLRHTSQFEKLDGGYDRACRGSDPDDNDPSYYKM